MPSLRSRLQPLLEIALIFAVFALQGAWPVPDVNEPYYLGKAIHYWNPGAYPGDFFMESADTHKVFYFAIGWLSLVLSPTALAWTGRVVTWLLLAWAWRRLSVAVVPRQWYSVLSAALFGCLMERCHMAGEWVIGGVEAKGFAYVLVFLGVEALVRNRWNRALWLFGGASAFHVLVGGWATVAAAVAWLWLTARRGLSRFSRQPQGDRHIFRPSGVSEEHHHRGRDQPPVGARSQSPACPTLRSLWPGMVGGLLLALPGLIPSLTLDWGAGRETLRQAHIIYVFDRLPHHLLLSGMRSDFIVRMLLLCVVWLLLGRLVQAGGGLLPLSREQCNHDGASGHRENGTVSLGTLRAFVAGAVLIACVGAAIHLLLLVDRGLAAGLLRYYWFRLMDVAVPLGVSLEAAALIASRLRAATEMDSARQGPPKGTVPFLRPPAAKIGTVPRGMGACWLALALVVVGFHLGDLAKARLAAKPARAYKFSDYGPWRAACDWIVHSGRIPPHATFIVPRMCETFHWDTGRNEVVSQKNVPQDAVDLVAWWQRMQDLYATGQSSPRWRETLWELGADRLRQLGAKYHADYLIETPAPEAALPAESGPAVAVGTNDAQRYEGVGWGDGQQSEALVDKPHPPPLDLPELYRNRSYVIYRLP